MGNCRSLMQILPEEEITAIQRETGCMYHSILFDFYVIYLTFIII